MSVNSSFNLKNIKKTLAYQFLELEAAVQLVPDETFSNLYKIADDFQDLYNKKFHASFKNSEESALIVLQSIEDILLKNYIISISPKSVHLLSRGLIPSQLTNDELRDISFWAVNNTRSKFIQQHRNSAFFKFDCDLYCFLYYSIGELFSFPINIVELDWHTYINWNIASEDYLNWEANEGIIRRSGNPSQYHILTRPEIRGYFYLTRGIVWQEKKRIQYAINDFKKSNQLYKNYHKVKCNLAWLYIAELEYITSEQKKKALELAQDAVKLYRHERNLFVYACALAENNYFLKAFDIMEELLEKRTYIKVEDYTSVFNAFKSELTYRESKRNKKK